MKRVIPRTRQLDRSIYDGFAKKINKGFKGCDMLGKTPAGFYKGHIYLFDVDHSSYVGALYPDGACSVCPSFWFDDYEKGVFRLPLNERKREKRRISKLVSNSIKKKKRYSHEKEI